MGLINKINRIPLILKKTVANLENFWSAVGIVDSDGNDLSSSGGLKVVDNAEKGTDTEYRLTPTGANADGVIEYTSATTITESGLSYTFNAVDIKSVKQIPASGKATVFTETNDFTVVSHVITVAGAAFTGTDTFEVLLSGSKKGFSQNADVIKTDDSNDSDKAFPETIVNDTNLAAATHDYLRTMFPNKDLSLSGKLIDADGTLTLKVYGTNSTDTATADWIQLAMVDDKTAGVITEVTVTNGTVTFGVSFNDLNYENVKIEVVASGATNTVVIESRKKAI